MRAEHRQRPRSPSVTTGDSHAGAPTSLGRWNSLELVGRRWLCGWHWLPGLMADRSETPHEADCEGEAVPTEPEPEPVFAIGTSASTPASAAAAARAKERRAGKMKQRHARGSTQAAPALVLPIIATSGQFVAFHSKESAFTARAAVLCEELEVSADVPREWGEVEETHFEQWRAMATHCAESVIRFSGIANNLALAAMFRVECLQSFTWRWQLKGKGTTCAEFSNFQERFDSGPPDEKPYMYKQKGVLHRRGYSRLRGFAATPSPARCDSKC